MSTMSLLEKWAPVLDLEGAPKIADSHRRFVTACMLENQMKAMQEEAQAQGGIIHTMLNEDVPVQTPIVNHAGFVANPTAGGDPLLGGGIAGGHAGGPAPVAGYDKVLINLVRRAMPQMIAFDVCGVQPMTAPAGMIFAMKSRYVKTSVDDHGHHTVSALGDEALFREADTGYAGNSFGRRYQEFGGAFDESFSGAEKSNWADAMTEDGIKPFADQEAGDFYDLNEEKDIQEGKWTHKVGQVNPGLEGETHDHLSQGRTDGDEAKWNTGYGYGLYDDDGFPKAGKRAGAKQWGVGHAMSTFDAEALGAGKVWGQMGFSIEKTTVTAQTRALRAEYTLELAQDLKAVHGLDAETELSNILATEILSEINREVIRNIYMTAKIGCQAGTQMKGFFDLDVDADGRWSTEKYKGLMMRIEREANAIAQDTRRGRGNFIICSSDVASALNMAGMLDYAPALQTNLDVNEAQSTFAGVLNGKYKVFVDPYQANQSARQFCVVGYKGATAYDAGMFYCPYVPLQLLRAQDPATFAPKIGFKTRYGLICNPFVQVDNGMAGSVPMEQLANKNYYYRKFAILNM